MKLVLTNNDTVYINPKEIVSVHIQEQTKYLPNSKQVIVFVVYIQANVLQLPIYENTDKAFAEEMLHKLGETIDSKHIKKTYLDGFKDGTEYALRLMEKKS